MKIQQATLSTQSHSQQQSIDRVEETMRFEVRSRAVTAPQPETRVSISDAGQEALASATSIDGTKPDSRSAVNERLSLLIAVVEQLTGRKVEVFDGSELQNAPGDGSAARNTASERPAPPPGPDWSLHFEHKEVHETSETMHFSAAGKVKIADGREISFDIALDMSRYERHSSEFSLDAGNVSRQDPLVLNLAGGPASLNAERIQFDLDSDGKPESMPTLGGGSAFLAIDRNGNGVIDDGSELFGPRTGSGFAELADLDSDHNGWIDESDLQFSQLQVWRPGGTLQSLGTAGVGAISLQEAATAFSLRENGDDRGQIRSTGIYLNEDGTPGTIQHVDLTV